MAPPLVSVVLPVYNGAAFLGEAVESVLGQTFTDFELLAINDGSTDASAQILARYTAADARVRVLSQENRCLIATLNRGCTEARGELLARMDADDISLPDRLARQVEFLRQHPGVAVVGTSVQLISRTPEPLRDLIMPSSEEQVARELELRSCLAHPTVMMRKDAWATARGYRRAFLHAEDYDLWLRIVERHALTNLPEPLLKYRVHADNISLKQIRQQCLSTIGARLAARARRAGQADPTEGQDLIREDFLLALGLTREEIEEEILYRYLVWADLLWIVRRPDRGLALLDEMDALEVAPSARRKTRKDARRIRAKTLLRDGQRIRGLVMLGNAVVSDPHMITRWARSRIRL